MHIYFSGIGGAGIGPLAQIAHQAGYTVSGSDKQDSSYIDYLKAHGINNIHIGQSLEAISAINAKQPIDWFVYSSAISLENANHPEIEFCKQHDIKTSKRDELLSVILSDKGLGMIGVAGTHGKTTTTAMLTWILQQAHQPASHLLPAKTNFTEMGEFNPSSKYFVYEADEFDRNFLAFEPKITLITGVSWDHHELFPTREDYQEAFREFINQSTHTYIWQEDAEYLGIEAQDNISVLDSADKHISHISLLGKYNRLDAWLAVLAAHKVTNKPFDELVEIVNDFPGLSRRMEPIAPDIYSDYAHTPEKIRGAMSVALEMASETGQKVVVVYEPLTNRRQHFMLNEYRDCFDGATKVYWLPSYLAREDDKQRVIEPAELISHLSNPEIAEAGKRGDKLKQQILEHLGNGDMVIGMAGGGGNSLDDWLRQEFAD